MFTAYSLLELSGSEETTPRAPGLDNSLVGAMIKREHLKQAIDAISTRNPEIGYSLDQMLGMGVIDIASRAEKGTEPDDPAFLFDGQRVPVNKAVFFNEGTVPIEQSLIIKYGELVKKQELQDKVGVLDYQEAVAEIHRAGLRLVVRDEIDYAIGRLRKELEHGRSSSWESGKMRMETLLSFLEAMKQEEGPMEIPEKESPPSVFYTGVVDVNTPAYFVTFPVCMDTLMQVADRNPEFFHVRFILNCLIRGLDKNLMACVTEKSIAGLIFLALKERFLQRALEIKYLATLSPKPFKGVGTFLLAGVWLVWKNDMPSLKEIVLDAEVEARRFYEAGGFESRGLSGYVLKKPKGYVLKSILSMTHHCRHLRKEVVQELVHLIVKEVKGLCKEGKGEKALAKRKATIQAVLECFKPEARPEFSEAASTALLKHRKKIPEALEILRNPFSKEAAKHAAGPGR